MRALARLAGWCGAMSMGVRHLHQWSTEIQPVAIWVGRSPFANLVFDYFDHYCNRSNYCRFLTPITAGFWTDGTKAAVTWRQKHCRFLAMITPQHYRSAQTTDNIITHQHCRFRLLPGSALGHQHCRLSQELAVLAWANTNGSSCYPEVLLAINTASYLKNWQC